MPLLPADERGPSFSLGAIAKENERQQEKAAGRKRGEHWHLLTDEDRSTR